MNNDAAVDQSKLINLAHDIQKFFLGLEGNQVTKIRSYFFASAEQLSGSVATTTYDEP